MTFELKCIQSEKDNYSNSTYFGLPCSSLYKKQFHYLNPSPGLTILHHWGHDKWNAGLIKVRQIDLNFSLISFRLKYP
jgi:hypothetical protein